MSVTQPLRDEHRELWPHVEGLRCAAEAVGRAEPAELARLVEAAYDFLSRHLLVHAQAEEEALYPVVALVMGAPGATATMSRDHAEVQTLTGELGALRETLGDRPADERVGEDLRRVLYGLYGIVRLHFAKEEEVYLPLLDAGLSEAEGGELFTALGAAAARARAG